MTTRPLFILLNGPSGVGKTEFKRYLVKHLGLLGVVVASDSFAAPIKNLLSTMLQERYKDIDKNAIHPLLKTTPNTFLYDLSEQFFKPWYGNDIFPRLLLHRTSNLKPPTQALIVDDLGTDLEDETTRPNVIIRMQRTGYAFKADDPRRYIGGPRFTIHNSNNLDMFEENAKALAGVIVSNYFQPAVEGPELNDPNS